MELSSHSCSLDFDSFEDQTELRHLVNMGILETCSNLELVNTRQVCLNRRAGETFLSHTCHKIT